MVCIGPPVARVALRSLRACPSNINPNCVSTASTNDTYGSAWRATDTDPLKAAEVFGPTSSRLLSVKSLEGVGQYRMFGVDNPFGGEDTLEW
ncbi:uncharacterized protein HaLaN_10859, partial [Haematococcus lacustris]